MNKFSLIIILFAVIVIGGTYLYIQLSEVNLQQIFNRETDSGSVFRDNNDGTRDRLFSDSQEQSNTGGSSGEGGESGGESGESAQETSQQSNSPCSMQQISYSLKKFQKFQLCEQYEQEFCIKKTINCSIEVTNLDNKISGEFEITFNYRDEQGNAFSPISKIQTLAPQESGLFTGALSVQDIQAQQTLSCDFDITKAPQRQVCT